MTVKFNLIQDRSISMKHLVCSLCILALFSFAALAQEPNWNQWRGPKSNNHSASTGIAKSWPAEGPKLLWKTEGLGDQNSGFSSVTFSNDKIFTLGDIENQAYLFMLDRTTGREVRRTHIGRGGDGGGRHVGTLSTPANDGETVFAMTQFGEFVAVNANNGEIRWKKNTVDEFGAGKMSQWGYSMSPIIDGDKILLPIGGEGGSLAAFSKSGNLLWRTDWLQDPVAHTSAVPVVIDGVRQYMLLTGQRLVGVSTDGKFLWGSNFPGQTAVCSDPVLCGDVIMASCHYNVGAYFYRLGKEGERLMTTNFRGPDLDLASHHGGIVAVGDYFYLLTNRELACVNAKTSETVWQNRSVGKGSMTYVDGMLILRSEGGDGTIAMVEASPEGYKEFGRFDQPDRSGRQAWAYPVVVDKRLYIRDQGVLLCYDLN